MSGDKTDDEATFFLAGKGACKGDSLVNTMGNAGPMCPGLLKEKPEVKCFNVKFPGF